MSRTALLTSLAISAVAAAPATAKPADVNVVNTVSVAGTVGLTPGTSVGIDPAANGVEITNAAPIPVAPVASTAKAVAFRSDFLLHDGETFADKTLIPASALEGKRFESTFVHVNAFVGEGQEVNVSVEPIFGGQLDTLPYPLISEPSGSRTMWSHIGPSGFIADGPTTVRVGRHGGSTGQFSVGVTVYGRVVDETAPAS